MRRRKLPVIEKAPVTPQNANKRLSLREALIQRAAKQVKQPEKQSDTVTKAVVEQPSIEVEKTKSETTSTQLESLCNALDDATEQENLNEIVQYCTDVSSDLSENEKQVLREKIKNTRKRLQPAPTEHVQFVRYANSTQNSWRFPDSSVVYDFLTADNKAKALGMKLETKSGFNFSESD